MSEPVVPPVPADILAQAEKAAAALAPEVIKNGLDVKADVALVKSKIKPDAAIAALLHIGVLLLAAYVMKLPAKDVAELGSLVTAFSAYFVTRA